MKKSFLSIFYMLFTFQKIALLSVIVLNSDYLLTSDQQLTTNN